MSLTLAQKWFGRTSTYHLTRFFLLRLVGLVYFVAFLTLLEQGGPLLGEEGLLPFPEYLDNLAEAYGSRWSGFAHHPSIFWLIESDWTLYAIAVLGAGVALWVLFGATNAFLMVLLWALHLSVINIGQLWYAFGWEFQLLETGFLAIFLCPTRTLRPFPDAPPSRAVVILFRWLIVRIMLGAGLIKVRHDSCWTDLTCLTYHFETQPVPGWLSSCFHALPSFLHKGGVLFNHMVELVVPVFVFGPRRIRHIAGLLLASLQFVLIISGNLSFLNWLTLVPILACFDDEFFARFLSHTQRLRFRARQHVVPATNRKRLVVVSLLCLAVAVLSIRPVANLISKRQRMNETYDRLQLVNSYGAFGAVDRARYELVVQGTDDDKPGPDTVWKSYEFHCKPGREDQRPCQVSPYHYRLDWLIWFAVRSVPEQSPWIYGFAEKLLRADRGILRLLASNPFPQPPRYVRILYYSYELEPPFSDKVWQRRKLAVWLPPTSLTDLQ